MRAVFATGGMCRLVVASLALAGLVGVGCRKAPPTAIAPAGGRLVIAVTVDWEGAYFSPEGLDALDDLRERAGNIPLTHFVSAAYWAKPAPDERAQAYLTDAVHDGDELALHLHGWASLATASEVQPRLSPSFITGTDKVLEFPDGDVGFDVDLDVYEVTELRALIRTSRRMLDKLGLPISTSFRAGGYIATPKVLQAIRAEGYDTDSSATYATQFDAPKDKVLRERIAEVWPSVTRTSAPFSIDTPGGPVLELPITGIVDYITTAAVTASIDEAFATLRRAPGTNVYLVFALHQETASEFARTLVEALTTARARTDLAAVLEFTTITGAAKKLRANPLDPTRPDSAPPTGKGGAMRWHQRRRGDLRGVEGDATASPVFELSTDFWFATLNARTEGA